MGVQPRKAEVYRDSHQHERGRRKRFICMDLWAKSGRREVLFNVPRYDFRWQERYYLKHPLLLPKGTKLITTAYFDNSVNNPLNPNSSKAIRYGEPSNEEMMTFFLHFAEPTAHDVSR